MPDNEIKLVCLPYAGGSEAVFVPLKKHLASGISLYPIEYPGRGARQNEPFYNTIADAASDIVKDISALNCPFAILGHSLGGLIGYEACRLLERGDGKMPIHLFVSGKQAPHIRIKEKLLHQLPDEDFKKEVLELGGTPEEIFEHPELSGYYLPILKADFKISELYEYNEEREKLKLDFTVIGGDKDDITPLQLAGWKMHTDGDFRVIMLSGGHFFINDNFKNIAEIINHTLLSK